MTRREQLYSDYMDVANAKILVVAIELPTGAIEVITNSMQIHDKINYYMNSYNEELKLNANHNVKILKWIIV